MTATTRATRQRCPAAPMESQEKYRASQCRGGTPDHTQWRLTCACTDGMAEILAPSRHHPNIGYHPSASIGDKSKSDTNHERGIAAPRRWSSDVRR
jgi:hypothetical protein